MKIRILIAAALFALVSTFNFQPAFAQGTAFTYQGRLNDGLAPANGIYDLRFTIYDAVSAGNLIAGPLTNGATGISNGLFTVLLDFGNVFPGTGRFLDIAVRTNGNGPFTTLSPRQPLTPAPYAITAGNVVSGGLASGTYSNALNFNNPADQLTGSFAGNGLNISNVNAATLGGLAAVNFWQLGGNNVGAGQFLGSANNQPVEIRVGGQRALSLELNTGTNGAPNIIAGSAANFVAPGVVGAAVAGGSTNYFVGGANSVSANFAAICGGARLTIQSNATYSIIGGGYNNLIETNSGQSVISGGSYNDISPNSGVSAIGGGTLSYPNRQFCNDRRRQWEPDSGERRRLRDWRRRGQYHPIQCF